MPRIEFETTDQKEAFHWWKMAKLEDPKNKTLGPLSEDPLTSVYEIDGKDLRVHVEQASVTHLGIDYAVISDNHADEIGKVYEYYRTRTQEQKGALYRNPQLVIDAVKSRIIFDASTDPYPASGEVKSSDADPRIM